MELKYKHLYKTVLKEYQNLSKCSRVKVAALIVKDGRILSCGYNGTPAGQTNCNELFKTEAGKFYARKTTAEEWLEYSEEEWKELHHEFANINEIHAEQNALGNVLREKINITDSSMLLTHEPCEACSRLIYTAGIKHVIYENKYDRGSNGIDFLETSICQSYIDALASILPEVTVDE